jgi:hypothetical protein
MNIRRSIWAGTLIFAWVSLFSPTAGAQGIQGVKGKITDEKTGQPIAAAQVIFQSVEITQTLVTKTNAKGEYTGLLGGKTLFRIIVRAQGYRTQFRENVRMKPEQMREENFSLVAGIDDPADTAIQGLKQFEKGVSEKPALQEYYERYYKFMKQPEKLHIPEYLKDLS